MEEYIHTFILEANKEEITTEEIQDLLRKAILNRDLDALDALKASIIQIDGKYIY